MQGNEVNRTYQWFGSIWNTAWISCLSDIDKQKTVMRKAIELILDVKECGYEVYIKYGLTTLLVIISNQVILLEWFYPQFLSQQGGDTMLNTDSQPLVSNSINQDWVDERGSYPTRKINWEPNELPVCTHLGHWLSTQLPVGMLFVTWLDCLEYSGQS